MRVTGTIAAMAATVMCAQGTLPGVVETTVHSRSLGAAMESSFRSRNEANSLRQAIQSRLGAPKACKPEDRLNEDRKCERQTKEHSGASCKERCHVWGDPHLAPFYDVCSYHSLGEEGGWPLYILPSKGQRSEVVNITSVVKKVDDEGTNRYRGKNWIRQLYVGGHKVMDVEEHCKNKPVDEARGYSKGDVIETWSDRAAKNDLAKDVEIEWTSYCHYKHDVWHLNITVDVRDFSDKAFKNAAKRTAGKQAYPPATTVYFKDDYGACVDPVQYGGASAGSKNCGRQTDLGLDGRDCSLQAKCGIYGDPYVYDFYSPDSTFQIPKKPTPAESVIYNFRDEFGVVIHTDDCEFIEAVDVYYRINEEDKNGCPASATASPKYTKKTYVADALCGKEGDTDHETRKRISVPSEVDAEYDSRLGGFALGTYLGTEPNTADASAPQYPTFQRLSTSRNKMSSCASAASAADYFYDEGAATVTLKCHRTAREKKAYFNACVQQTGMIKQKFEGDWDEVLNVENVYWGEKLNGETALKAFQKDSATAGHCALGKKLDGDYSAKGATATYEHRKAGEYALFSVVTDTE